MLCRAAGARPYIATAFLVIVGGMILLSQATTPAPPAKADNPERTLIGFPNETVVIVWKNDQALRKGTDLISAGVAKRNPSMVYGLISYVVPVGDKAIITDRPFHWHPGCVG